MTHGPIESRYFDRWYYTSEGHWFPGIDTPEREFGWDFA
jgi:hypothetical protein